VWRSAEGGSDKKADHGRGYQRARHMAAAKLPQVGEYTFQIMIFDV
jgi:hypothetical protein